MRRFAYALALEAGRLEVRRWMKTMSGQQLLEWEAYAALEPFGESRADHRAALIAQTVFNMAVAVKDRRPLKDFLLNWEQKEKKKQTPKQQLAMLSVLAAMFSTDSDRPDALPGSVSVADQDLLDKARAAMKRT